MKHLIRTYLINVGALWVTSQALPALTITGGTRGLLLGSLAFMAANLLLVPLLKVLLLPLNLLTLGVFAWLGNVLALYFLVTVMPVFKVASYHFPGMSLNGFIIPQMELSTFLVVVVSSFLIGLLIHVVNWLIK